MRRRFVTMASVIALGLVNMACGGDDSPAGGAAVDSNSADASAGIVPSLPEPESDSCDGLYSYLLYSEGVMMGQTAQEWLNQYEALKASIPSALRSQLELSGEAYGAIAEALIAAGGDLRAMAEANPQLEPVIESIEDGEVTVAQRALADYYEAEC